MNSETVTKWFAGYCLFIIMILLNITPYEIYRLYFHSLPCLVVCYLLTSVISLGIIYIINEIIRGD